ncbi:MAG: NAD(P)-dependent oxidoreductase [Dehalococcoidia bacterium]
MTEILVTRDLGDEFRTRLAAVDSVFRVRQAPRLLERYILGRAPIAPEDRSTLTDLLAECLTPAEIVVGWPRFPEDALPHAPRLRWIQTLSAGFDGVPRAVRERVTLTTGRGITAEPLADHVLCLLLMLARSAHRYVRRQAEHYWERGWRREITGMTMGLVGLGTVGGAIARPRPRPRHARGRPAPFGHRSRPDPAGG